MLLLLPLLAQKRSHHFVYRACPLFLLLSLSLSPRCTRLVRLVTDYSLWDTMVGHLNNSRSRRAPHTLNSFSLCFFFFPVLYIYIFYRYIYLLIFVLGRNTRDSFASLVREGRISHLFDTKTREKAQDYSASIWLWKEFYCRPSMRTCDQRAMCRILSLVAVLTRTHKNYVDGTPLRNETRLRVAGNGLFRSRASSPRFVPCVLSRLQRDSSYSV